MYNSYSYINKRNDKDINMNMMDKYIEQSNLSTYYQNINKLKSKSKSKSRRTRSKESRNKVTFKEDLNH